MRSKLDALILYMEQSINANETSTLNHEPILPLTVDFSIFKGKKPVGII